MRSHHSGEAWGLAVHNGLIYTVGDDSQLLVWNMETRQLEGMYNLWAKAVEKKHGANRPQKEVRVYILFAIFIFP
jgi:hypothetical protein